MSALWSIVRLVVELIGWLTLIAVVIGWRRTRNLADRRARSKSAIETTIRTTYADQHWAVPIVVTVVDEQWLVDAIRQDDGGLEFVWVQVGE